MHSLLQKIQTYAEQMQIVKQTYVYGYPLGLEEYSY